MLTPEQIGNAADAIMPVYERLEEYVIKKLAENFAKNSNEWTSSSATLVMNAEDIGMTFDEIMQEVSRINNLSAEQTEKIISSAGCLNIVDEDKRLAGIDLAIRSEQIPFLNQVINEYINQANAELMNITRTKAMGFTYQTASGVQFRNLSGYYMQKLDESALGVRTGLYTAQEALKTFIQDCASSGLRMQYPSGYTCDVDVAARRAILTGVSQMAQKQNEDIAKELNMPYAEVTAHQGARPTHQVWQGRIFKIEGSEPGYPNLYEATGLGTVTGLLGANCRHQWHPWDKGLPRVYTDEQLKNIDPPPIEYNGKEYSYYDCTQKQRSFERAIRKKKREIAGYEGANDTESLAKANGQLKELQKGYRDFSKAAGLKTKSERTAIYNFKNAESQINVIPKYYNKDKGLAAYRDDEIFSMSNDMNNIANKYLKNKSKWSGTTIIDNSMDESGKLWNCDIATQSITSPHILLHEHIHAHSVSYANPKLYKENQKIEESSVQLLCEEISNIEKIKMHSSGYKNEVDALKLINNNAKIKETNLEFALELISVPLENRFNWLYAESIKNITKMNNVDAYSETIELLEALRGEYVQPI